MQLISWLPAVHCKSLGLLMLLVILGGRTLHASDSTQHKSSAKPTNECVDDEEGIKKASHGKARSCAAMKDKCNLEMVCVHDSKANVRM